VGVRLGPALGHGVAGIVAGEPANWRQRGEEEVARGERERWGFRLFWEILPK
jgi:hypothetical protein